jgi:hypothetical protein
MRCHLGGRNLAQSFGLTIGPMRKVLAMSHTKRVSKQKRRSKTAPVLGAAGLSLSLAGGASTVTAAPAADMPAARHAALNHQIFLGEEELSDVTLATFYVFDKENAEGLRPGIQLVRGGCGCGHGGGCGGCGHGGGCGGCGHGGGVMRGCGGGFGGCRGCGFGRGCGYGGCGGCWGWGMGGWGGCCLSWGGCALC